MDTYEEGVEVSNVLNETKAYITIGKRLGIEIDSNSMIFHDIEQFIVQKYKEMEEESLPFICGSCGEKCDSYEYNEETFNNFYKLFSELIQLLLTLLVLNFPETYNVIKYKIKNKKSIIELLLLQIKQ